MIDGLIINIASFFGGFIIGFIYGVSVALVGGQVNQTFASILGGIVGLVVGWLYFSICEASSMMATPGKKLFGLKVTDTNGHRIGFGKATGRYFGKFLSLAIVGIGYFMAGWTEKKQALHDMMAGCLIIKEKSS